MRALQGARRRFGPGTASLSQAPHGTMHPVPLLQMPAQRPVLCGTQADPAGNPFRTQSASRLQPAHLPQTVSPDGQVFFAQ